MPVGLFMSKINPLSSSSSSSVPLNNLTISNNDRNIIPNTILTSATAVVVPTLNTNSLTTPTESILFTENNICIDDKHQNNSNLIFKENDTHFILVSSNATSAPSSLSVNNFNKSSYFSNICSNNINNYNEYPSPVKYVTYNNNSNNKILTRKTSNNFNLEPTHHHHHHHHHQQQQQLQEACDHQNVNNNDNNQEQIFYNYNNHNIPVSIDDTNMNKQQSIFLNEINTNHNNYYNNNNFVIAGNKINFVLASSHEKNDNISINLNNSDKQNMNSNYKLIDQNRLLLFNQHEYNNKNDVDQEKNIENNNDQNNNYVRGEKIIDKNFRINLINNINNNNNSSSSSSEYNDSTEASIISSSASTSLFSSSNPIMFEAVAEVITKTEESINYRNKINTDEKNDNENNIIISSSSSSSNSNRISENQEKKLNRTETNEGILIDKQLENKDTLYAITMQQQYQKLNHQQNQMQNLNESNNQKITNLINNKSKFKFIVEIKFFLVD